MAKNEIEGLDKLLAQLESLKDLDVAKIASAGGFVILGDAQDKAPYKTGFLKNSGYIEPIDGQGCEIGFSAEYAYYQEYGTANYSGKPYLRPAIDEKADEAVIAMANEGNKEMEAKL